jgi:N-acetyl-gamma-glutamyl-phosphate reductase
METIRLLAGHPAFTLHHIYASKSAGKGFADAYPAFSGVFEKQMLPMEALDEDDADAMVLALPHGHSMAVVQKLVDRGYTGRIVDLGSDFRLKNTAEYEQYYGQEHAAPHLIPGFVYGLSEWFTADIKQAAHLANPGCFATAIQLALLPLVHDHLLDTVSITAITGSSGSGATASDTTHFSTRFGNMKAYKIFGHQHEGEIYQSIRSLSVWSGRLHFTPVSGPFVRGIWAAINVKLTRPADLQPVFEQAYALKPFVRVTKTAPELKHVIGSNFTDIGWKQQDLDAVIVVAMDNLVKGAAGQAVQNLNLMFGLDETAGLLTPPLVL